MQEPRKPRLDPKNPDKPDSPAAHPLAKPWTVWAAGAYDLDAPQTQADDAGHPLAKEEGIEPPHSKKTDGARSPEEGASPGAAAPLPDAIDPILIGRMDTRRLAVEPGDVASLAISLLNNSTEAATFTVGVEGWVDETWFPDLPQAIDLEPGLWTTISIAITPPRAAHSWAGDHPFALTLRSPQHPERVTRLGALLTLAPFDAFQLAPLTLEFAPNRTRRGTAVASVRITNTGNRLARYRIQGVDAATRGTASETTRAPRSPAHCEFVFRAAGDSQIAYDTLDFDVEPGATRAVGCRVKTLGLPPIGPLPRIASFSLVVEQIAPDRKPASTHPKPPRRVIPGEIKQAPLVGVWTLTAMLSLIFGAIVFAVIVGVMTLVSLQNRAAQTPAAEPQQPIFAIMLHMEEPLPQRNTPTSSPASIVSGMEMAAAPVPVVGVTDVTAPGQVPPTARLEGEAAIPAQEGALAFVQANQITAPSEPLRAGDDTDDRAFAASPASGAPAGVSPLPESSPRMTYAQMFQDVGMRYDLDWRMLAAQAYVESGFDALALGSRGSMGLMQIQPQTWREWAPVISAADPFDSYSNALIAGLYLDYLRSLLASQGYPQTEWMLVAYNWGPDQLLGFLSRGGEWASLPAEVRSYAEDVLRIARTIPGTN